MEKIVGDSQLNALAGEVIGAAIDVHRALGPGLFEEIYKQAMCVELAYRSIPYCCEHRLPVEYRGEPVGQGRLDLLVDQKLIVELKAIDALAPIHTAQLISYLRIARIKVGLLINFNVVMLKNGIKRVCL